MKIFATAVSLLTVSCLTAQPISFNIQGQVGQVSSPAKAYLSYRQMNKAIVDSSVVNNGTFTMSGSIAEPVQATLTLNYSGVGGMGSKKAHKKTFYLEAGSIKVKSKDSLSTATIKGGQLNKDYQALTKVLEPTKTQMDAFMADYFALPKEQQQDSSIRAVLDKKYNAITEKQNAAYSKFISSHSNSIVALDALKVFGGSTPEFDIVSPLYNGFSAAVKNSSAGKEYAENLAKLEATNVGAMAPQFTQNDPNGNPVQLSSFKGKYLLIDFWASWCGPCRAENPNVVKAYAKYHEQGFDILGVSLDNDKGREKWLNAIQKDSLTWTQVTDLKYWNNEVAKLYAIRSIPQNFLLDPTGKIIAKNIRGEALQNKLAEIFKP